MMTERITALEAHICEKDKVIAQLHQTQVSLEAQNTKLVAEKDFL